MGGRRRLRRARPREGRSFTARTSELWIAPDGPWTEAFAAQFATGVDAARGYLLAHGLDAGAARIEAYLCERSIVSHAPGGPFLFLSRSMAEAERAPWLHEAVHVLLRGERDWLTDLDAQVADRDMPLWLIEGLTEYVAQSTAEAAGLANDGPFTSAIAELDAACAVARAEGPAPIFAAVGRPGRPAELFGRQRFANASVFYPCATSFVAFLAKQHGVDALLAAVLATPDEVARWEARTGASIAAERDRWEAQIRRDPLRSRGRTPKPRSSRRGMSAPPPSTVQPRTPLRTVPDGRPRVDFSVR